MNDIVLKQDYLRYVWCASCCEDMIFHVLPIPNAVPRQILPGGQWKCRLRMMVLTFASGFGDFSLLSLVSQLSPLSPSMTMHCLR